MLGVVRRTVLQCLLWQLKESKEEHLELFEFILLLKLDKQFPVEQFEATVSQSTVPSPPLKT